MPPTQPPIQPPAPPPVPTPAATPSRFYIEQDYKLMREAFHVTDGTNLICVADMKLMSLKAHIDVYRDEAKTQPAFQIQQASMVAASKLYEVTDATGQKMGAFRFQSMASLINEHWEILDAAGTPTGTIEQDTTKAMLGRFLRIIPQTFIASINGQPVCSYVEEMNMGVRFKMDIDFSADPSGSFDRTLGIAAAILMSSRHNQTQ